MKAIKNLFIIITLLLRSITSLLFAQSSETQDYLVTNSGDTLYGHVRHIDERGVNRRFYKKIRFTGINGNKKKYKRNDVYAFRVNNANYEGFWLNQSSQKIVLINPKYDIDPNNGARYFLKVVSKGKLSHYELEWFEQGDTQLMWMDLLKKEEDQFFIRATQGIFGLKRKVLLNYFFDCPKLQEQISQKQLKQVWQVVNFYNQNCI